MPFFPIRRQAISRYRPITLFLPSEMMIFRVLRVFLLVLADRYLLH
jgi:hypothetical protein